MLCIWKGHWKRNGFSEDGIAFLGFWHFCLLVTQMKFLKYYNAQMQERNLEENGQPIINMHITDCGVVNSVDEVPPPMLLQDFISQVRLEIMPFIRRNPEKPDQWEGGKSTYAEHLKQRAAESQSRFEESKKEGDELAEDPDDGSPKD